MGFTISIDRLNSRLSNTLNNTAIVDVRFDLADPDAGRKAYLAGHLPGAVYLDLNKDLSGSVKKHGGNHPLPDMDMFARKIGNIGIDNGTTVVIYDQNNDMFAARLWWLLHYMGHEKVYVLDGGFDRWVLEGNEVTTAIPALKQKQFEPSFLQNAVAHMEEVRKISESGNAILIDSRSRERYLGENEPMYLKAGHIPGAKNFFWKSVLREDGLWKNKQELEKHFSNFAKDGEIIVSCGSGVSACPNILALKTAGFKNVKLYPGSFSDWISYEENQVRTGEK